ncbi:MAG: LysR family transcriptional regulator [Tannerellaceae bacterium]|nr:LysR family transcriptional regulator [Tannerellaceae bacterium]
MDIAKLRSFFMVADLGNFSEAADRLYLSQSTVSKHVMKLEEELGIQLLARNGKSFVLTEAGRTMLRYYSEILEIYDRSVIAAERLKKKNGFGYELKVVGGNRMSHYGLIHSLTAFLRIHPEVKLSIDDTESKSVLFALRSGDYELAFCQNTMLDSSEFSWQSYLPDSFVAVVCVGTELAKRNAIFLRDLKDKHLIVGSKENDHCRKFAAKENLNLDIAFETNDPATAIEILISAPDSIYIAPKTVMLKYTGELTTQIPLKGMGVCDYVLAWRKKAKLSSAAKDYLRFLREHSAQEFVQETLERKIAFRA